MLNAGRLGQVQESERNSVWLVYIGKMVKVR